jgi:hypothetical protein
MGENKIKFEKDIEYKIIYQDLDGVEKVDYGYYLGEDEFLIQFHLTNLKKDRIYSKKSIHKII